MIAIGQALLILSQVSQPPSEGTSDSRMTDA